MTNEDVPYFTDPNQAKDFLIKQFEEFIEQINKTPNHEQKVRIIKEFDMNKFSPENQPLGDKKVKDYQEYQKAKELVYDFFKWLEDIKKINVFQISQEDNFFNESQRLKTMIIALSLQIIPGVPVEVQIYLILNILRTSYELNFKNMTLILNEFLKKENKPTKQFYYLDNFGNEFIDYPRIEEIKEYFRNDLRNIVAHEEWFIKEDCLLTRNKGIEKNQDLNEISKQIYELFYFRVALSTYLLGGYRNFAKDRGMTPEQVNLFVREVKQKIEEIKRG